ncbi:MAG: hypothetical protein NWF08_02300 [Candidatus Bathyarchaeota archaeon]|nr:hypothetical protein [Candidatus Bathyarchaeota archaeon]
MVSRKEDDHKSEGTNLLYKIAAISLMMSMDKYKSFNFYSALRQTKNVLDYFKKMLEHKLNTPIFADYDSLKKTVLLKDKHYYYGGYLAALSSYPILYKINDKIIFDAMLAKTAAITSIKILDNIDDRHYTKSDSVDSQIRHLQAFTSKRFEMPRARDFYDRAENSCYEIARWTYQIANKELPQASPTWKIYLEDFQRYIDGQIKSMNAKKDLNGDRPTIKDYIQKINEKSVGRIWIDIDFCLLEQSLGGLTDEELYVIQNVRKAVDYLFKGCNIYDDVADLEEDLSMDIMNSVVLLGLDRGHIDEHDLCKDKKKLFLKLKQRGAIDETVLLGDVLFLEGIKPLEKTEKISGLVDLGALIQNAKILRAFAIRKWMFHEKNASSLLNTMKSFGNHKYFRIPESVIKYQSYI